MLKQLAVWLGAPALATWMLVQVLAGFAAEPVSAPLPPPAAGCVSHGDEMFDDCAVLDPSQVRDLRPGWDEKVCSDAAGQNCWLEHHADDSGEVEAR
jgi:hypothetical protein